MNEKGLISKRSVPIIMELVSDWFKMAQIVVEDDIIVDNVKRLNAKGEDDINHGECDDVEEVCSICIEVFGDEVEVLDCQHRYHGDCISEWMKHNPVCPECRAFIKPVKEFPPL